MAAPSSIPSQPSRPAVTSAPSNASLRLEKSNPGVRRSTPDSDALASSEDESEHLSSQAISASMSKPVRRTSWLNEVPSGLPRKGSLPTGSLSSAASNPATTATDQTWAPTTSPSLAASSTWGHAGGSTFPWGTGIWNTESRKEPPPRLAEIVPSPTMSIPPNTSGSVADELLSPITRTISGESAIPFTIPLHPTPKTYRSQSYSVGQLDPESIGLAARPAASFSAGRGRNASQFSALQHRSSRPSLLGELGHDPAMLGRVREDDDDGDSANGSESGYNYNTNHARTIEQLARENALLRQAAGQLDGSRFRERAMSNASANSGFSMASGAHNLHRIRGSVPEESDLAVEDLDELGNIPGYNNTRSNTRRRFSEHSANLEKQLPTFTSLENRTLENVKRAHWQTSLGFGSMADLPQSRRHSFADIPTRHGSIGSAGEQHTSISGINPRSGLGDRDDGYVNYTEGPLSSNPGENREYQHFRMTHHLEERELELEHLQARNFAASYFSGREQALRAETLPAAQIPSSLHQAYNMPTAYGRQHSNLAHPHQNQLLFIVTFKCHRADVFYIQEDTGLQVKPGDLVIVEADRGTDLGTIQHANVSLQKARELKEQYAEEHYKWLMMFSRRAQDGAANVVNPNGALQGVGNRSAIGGMGPPGSHGAQESQVTEIKPKLIKRLAQNHEILTLRDKEGNEAKAKRVCQQKVAEHRLNMEILDAEFQMDWKKLTFYYFADSYINFNSLVTDLFKIYKTRIWMSAINPASFVTPPTAGLQSPAGMGNALSYGQDGPHDRRHHHDHRSYTLTQAQSGNIRDPLDSNRDAITSPMGGPRNPYVDTYPPFGQSPRQPEAGFDPVAQASNDPFASSYLPNAFGAAGLMDYTSANNVAPNAAQRAHAQSEWVNRFQGLSLGS
ncbi:hypothetical protein Plec18170_004695 [Paecilomyces lecythidis]